MSYLKFILVLALLVLSGCKTARQKTQDKAKQFFIAIECGEEPAGSGFPVGKDLVMTARHVGCGGDLVPSISLDNGLTWKVEKNWMFNYDADVAIIKTSEVLFREWAVFRKPVLGEEVANFGMAYGDLEGMLGFGIIARVDSDHYYSTAIPISGISGSALLGLDGDVVGIMNHGEPDTYVGGTLSGGYPGDFLKGMRESYLEHVKLKEWSIVKGKE